MRQLRDCTEQIAAPWVRSAFVGNAGIVAFDERVDIAVKAETHNHPSAIEPFGGSNTGVGGVIRDVLGVSARPIAITDVLCFGMTDVDANTFPDGVLHPTPYPRWRDRRRGRLRQQDRPTHGGRRHHSRPGLHGQPIGVCRLCRRASGGPRSRRRIAGRPHHCSRWPHRPRRHPRRDVLLDGDGRHHRRRGRRERADRRPGHRTTAHRSHRRRIRRRSLHGHHRLRSRWVLVGDRRNGRSARRRCEPRRSADESMRA